MSVTSDGRQAIFHDADEFNFISLQHRERGDLWISVSNTENFRGDTLALSAADARALGEFLIANFGEQT